jgi:hypothetical protein
VQVAVRPPSPFVNTDVTLQAVGSPGGPQPVAAHWDFGDRQAGDGVQVTHRWSDAGRYRVGVIATFPDGRTASAGATVPVKGPPTLTVTPPANGTVTGTGGIDCPAATCTATFKPGDRVTLTATPTGVFTAFGRWGNDCSGTRPSCTLTMDGDRTVSASFVPKPRLSVLRNGASGNDRVLGPGIFCPPDCSTVYDPGTSVRLTAQPGAVVRFTGPCREGSGHATCTVTMNGDVTVTATFGAAAQPTAAAQPAPDATGRPDRNARRRRIRGRR